MTESPGKPYEGWRGVLHKRIENKEIEIDELRAEITKLLARIEKLRGALEWYADDHHYQAVHAIEQTVLIMVDHGERAERALAEDLPKAVLGDSIT